MCNMHVVNVFIVTVEEEQPVPIYTMLPVSHYKDYQVWAV